MRDFWDRLFYILVRLQRIRHSRGFGIQSPTDYRFERSIVNEALPYYAYDWLGEEDDWLRRKLGLLYFRLANWRQPAIVIDKVGVAEYLTTGCKKSLVVSDAECVELAVVPSVEDALLLMERCDNSSVIVVENIMSQKEKWYQLLSEPRVTISYDLYYCAILLFDSARVKQHYIINF